MARRKKVGELRDTEVECGYCDAIIPEDVLRCPKCGKLFSAAKKLMAFAIVVIVVIASMTFLIYNRLDEGQRPGGDDPLSINGDDNGTPASNATTKTIKVELYVDSAPTTTKNFIDLARGGKYDGVTFHRVIDDFMIQTGDFQYGKWQYSPTSPPGTGGYAAQYHSGLGDPDNPETWLIPDEFAPGLTHERGVLSMANRGPDTGGSQFFFVQGQDGAHHLDGKHAIFGRVTQGMNYVDEIAKVPKNASDQPLDPVTMKRVTILEEGGKTFAVIVVEY